MSPQRYWNAYIEFIECNGQKKNSSWENYEDLKSRTTQGIENILMYNNPLVITHSIIISLYTGITREGIPHCKPISILEKDLQCNVPDFINAIR